MKSNRSVAKSLAKEEELRFFKVMTSMDFPPECVARLQGIIRRRITLRDVDKNLWTVEVKRGGINGLYFDKGWPQFYEENSLEAWDVVAFEYKGGDLFNFKLYGRDGCEKKGVGGPKFRVKEEAEEIADDDDDEDYVVEELEDEEIKNISKSNKGLSSFNASSKKRVKEEEIEIEVGEDEDEEIEMLMKVSKLRPSPSPSSSSSLKHKKRDIKDYYGHDIFGAGLAIRPKNPYFVSRSRKTRKNELHIPNEVIEGRNLKIPARMLVVDGRGNKWESTTKKWRDGRLWCTGGWKRMCSANNIGPNDTCICEFVQQGSNALYMLVHVVDAAAK